MQTLQTRGESNSSMLAHCEKWEVWIPMFKESNSRANEGKRQFNRSIIYYLKIVPIVNDSFLKFKKKKLLQKVKKS